MSVQTSQPTTRLETMTSQVDDVIERLPVPGSANDVIDIPAPDYDDLEDDVTTTSCHDNDDKKDGGQVDIVASVVANDVIAADEAGSDRAAARDDEQTSDFTQVRAKLEEYSSRDKNRVLAGTCLANEDDKDADCSSAAEPVIPEPDYSDSSSTESDDEGVGAGGRTEVVCPEDPSPSCPSATAVGVAKTSISPPIQLTPQQIQLQRELMLNNKLGISVLNKKSELQKEFAKRKEREQDRLLEQQSKAQRSTLDRKLAEQAHKLALAEAEAAATAEGKTSISKNITGDAIDQNLPPEFVKIYSKLCKT